MNLNDFAKSVAQKEGKKLNLSIAQIKEVIAIVFGKLAKMKPEDLAEMLRRRYGKK